MCLNWEEDQNRRQLLYGSILIQISVPASTKIHGKQSGLSKSEKSLAKRNATYELVYFKELHNEQECYWQTIYREA